MRLYAKRADVVLLKDKKPLYERLILVFKLKTKKRKLQRERRGRRETRGIYRERRGDHDVDHTRFKSKQTNYSNI